MSELSRRKFIQTTAAGTVAASATTLSATTLLAQSPAAKTETEKSDRNSTIRVAVLGVNGRGWRAHTPSFEAVDGVEVAVLCDPDKALLEKRQKEFEKKYGRKVDIETDMRKVFDRKDIDVVGVATPNHWHSLATIWACQAGKDVYVEKPGSHNLFEGRQMIAAAKKYKRVVQHGVQLRSNVAVQEGIKHIRDGLIGDVYMARGLVFRWRPSIGKKTPENTPETLDWNLYQGPAQERPFSKRYVHYNWHWHWDFGNGDVGNQGVHETDLCLWGLDVGLPSKINAMGGKFLWDDDKETPELLTTNYFYPEQKKMIQFEVRPWNTNAEDGATVGNIFYGSEGYMVFKNYGSYETYLGRKRKKGPARKEGGELLDHFKNFIQAVRDRKTENLNGPVETAHTSSGLAHLGNIAYRLGRQLKFDPKTETFPGDAEANKMLTRKYREPFVVPKEV